MKPEKLQRVSQQNRRLLPGENPFRFINRSVQAHEAGRILRQNRFLEERRHSRIAAQDRSEMPAPALNVKKRPPVESRSK